MHTHSDFPQMDTFLMLFLFTTTGLKFNAYMCKHDFVYVYITVGTWHENGVQNQGNLGEANEEEGRGGNTQ